MSDIENVIAGRFPTSDSLKAAEDLLDFIPSIASEDRDRQLIRLGLHPDELTGLRDSVARLNEAVAIVSRELLPARRSRDDSPALSIALHPAGEVVLYVTRRLSANESAMVQASINTMLDAWSDVPQVLPSPDGSGLFTRGRSLTLAPDFFQKGAAKCVDISFAKSPSASSPSPSLSPHSERRLETCRAASALLRAAWSAIFSGSIQTRRLWTIVTRVATSTLPGACGYGTYSHEEPFTASSRT